MSNLTKSTDWILQSASILTKLHYRRNEIEWFYQTLNIDKHYEDNQNKEHHVAYKKGLEIWLNENDSSNDFEELLIEKLKTMNWNRAAKKIKGSKLKNFKCKTWGVPAKRQEFVGREAQLKALDEKLKTDGAHVVISACVGLGGIGKTSLTAEYVWKNVDQYNYIVWFNSGMNDNLLHKEFLRFGEELNITENGNREIEPIIQYFLNTNGWLIIFDNVTTKESIQKYFPNGVNNKGKILITSRNRIILHQCETIVLEKYSQEEVNNYLEKMIPQIYSKTSKETLVKFANELDFHPLAISQAASYILELTMSIEDYIKINKDFQLNFSLKSIEDEERKLFISSYKSLLISFMMSVKIIDEEAIDCLNKCAFLVPELIPTFLFSTTTLKTLHKYYLITLDNKVFSIHRLTQKAILFLLAENFDEIEGSEIYGRTKISNEFEKAFKLVESKYPIGKVTKKDLIIKYQLLPHFNSLIKHQMNVMGYSFDDDDTHPNFKRKLKNIKIKEIDNKDTEEFNAKLKQSHLLMEKMLISTERRMIKNDKIKFKLYDAIKFYEISCSKTEFEEILQNLLKCLKILKLYLQPDHELVIEITLLIALHYFRKYLVIKSAKTQAEGSVYHDAVYPFFNLMNKKGLARSYALECLGFYYGYNDKRKLQVNRFQEAYKLQLENTIYLNVKEWAKNWAEKLSLNRQSINEKQLFSNTFNGPKGVGNNSLYEFYNYEINFWFEQRQKGLSFGKIFTEVLKYDLYWNEFSNANTPLEPDNSHLLVQLNEIKLQLENNATIDQDTLDGALKIAVSLGNFDMAILLIEKGADVNITVQNNIPLIHSASKEGKIELVKLLIQKRIKIDAIEETNYLTPLHAASKFGHLEIAKFLIENRACVNATEIDSWTPLHYASKHGHLAIVELLIQNGANVNATQNDLNTPLHGACQYSYIEIVELLLKHGADIDAMDKNGLTPLHVAAKFGNSKIAHLLITCEADVDSLDCNNYSPLHYAASKRGLSKIVKDLVENGADSTIVSICGRTPLNMAELAGDEKIIELLNC